MPKDEIDYSNTIIYKIYCKDTTICETYINHTTNLIKRKYQHKYACNNNITNISIYDVIRSNGGWNNWNIVEIANYNCVDNIDARLKVQYHCEQDKNTQSNNWKSEEISKRADFVCNSCDFKCSKKSNFEIHINTKKHLCRLAGNASGKKSTKKFQEFVCECGKIYISSSGLWKHRKLCKPEICDDKNIEDKVNDNQINANYKLPKDFKLTPQMFYDLIQQNNDLQKSIIALASEKTPINITNTTNTNCGNNNKTFNLQIFLNETCKDAINITDFVDQIQLTINDLEETGKLGYTEGISRVFLNNLNGMDSTTRPIHCSNSKQETLYIKDQNEWHKEDDNKTILTRAIKQVANKNIKQILEWQKLHPKYNDPESKQNDKYMQIVLNSMSGSTKEESERNYEKIIKNVIKETIINKSNY